MMNVPFAYVNDLSSGNANFFSIAYVVFLCSFIYWTSFLISFDLIALYFYCADIFLKRSQLIES